MLKRCSRIPQAPRRLRAQQPLQREEGHLGVVGHDQPAAVPHGLGHPLRPEAPADLRQAHELDLVAERVPHGAAEQATEDAGGMGRGGRVHGFILRHRVAQRMSQRLCHSPRRTTSIATKFQ